MAKTLKKVFLSALILVAIPAGVPTPHMAKVRLGKKLFSDKILSADRTVSCASCHKPDRAFTSGNSLDPGAFGRKGDRNVPTLINRREDQAQFWDRRAESLSAQLRMVLVDHNEMGNDLPELLRRLAADDDYEMEFRKVFGRTVDLPALTDALVAYQQTLHAGEAPYDRYLKGDLSALSSPQLRGKELFFDKFKCVSCHSGPNFTDEKLNVRCYPFAPGIRAVPTQLFKTPTLRNLKFTGPYMHNGSLKTLEAAVDFYNPSRHLNARGEPVDGDAPVVISESEKRDLVAFLESLSAERPFVEIGE